MIATCASSLATESAVSPSKVVRSSFTTAREAADPDFQAKSGEARIYYGHGMRLPEYLPAFIKPAVADTNARSSATTSASIGLGDQFGPNEYAGEWTLLRNVTLLSKPETTAERFPTLPDLPTFREIGIPEVVATAWIGVVAPATTPAPLVTRINQAFVAALKDPQVVERLRAQGMETVGDTPAQFAAFMKEELDRWGPVIRRAGVTLE